jgi:hypothetical protein
MLDKDDDDDDLSLSSAAQAALAEFLAEKELQEASLPADSDEPISIDSFPEDWQVPPLPNVASGSCIYDFSYRNFGMMMKLQRL